MPVELGKSRVSTTFVGVSRTTAWHAVREMTSDPKKWEIQKHTATDPYDQRLPPTKTKQREQLCRFFFSLFLLFNRCRLCVFVRKCDGALFQPSCLPARPRSTCCWPFIRSCSISTVLSRLSGDSSRKNPCRIVVVSSHYRLCICL